MMMSHIDEQDISMNMMVNPSRDEMYILTSERVNQCMYSDSSTKGAQQCLI